VRSTLTFFPNEKKKKKVGTRLKEWEGRGGGYEGDYLIVLLVGDKKKISRLSPGRQLKLQGKRRGKEGGLSFVDTEGESIEILRMESGRPEKSTSRTFFTRRRKGRKHPFESEKVISLTC